MRLDVFFTASGVVARDVNDAFVDIGLWSRRCSRHLVGLLKATMLDLLSVFIAQRVYLSPSGRRTRRLPRREAW